MSTEHFPYTPEGTVEFVARMLAEETDRWTIYVLNRPDGVPLHRRLQYIAAELWCKAQDHHGPGVDAPPCTPCWEAIRLVLDERARSRRMEADFYGEEITRTQQMEADFYRPQERG